jgi:hypothetical protein
MTLKTYLNGLDLLDQTVVLLTLILELVELKLEEHLEEKKKLVVVENQVQIHGNNI